MTRSRLAAVLAILTASGAALGSATAVEAAPTGHTPPAPKPGNYAVHSKGAWVGASMKIVKKGGKLTLTSLSWTETKKAAAATNGICPAGDYSVISTAVVHPILTAAAIAGSHQREWVVGRYKKGEGQTAVKVKVKTPTGTKTNLLLITFANHGHSGDEVFGNYGSVGNVDSTCKYDFKHHLT